MTVGAWLRERAPAPPPLMARVIELLDDDLDDPIDTATETLLARAERVLRELVARPSAGRESALDLLTVDALVTFAFEAASANPDLLPARTTDAMHGLSRLAS